MSMEIKDRLIALNHKISTKRQELEVHMSQAKALRSELAALRTEREGLKARLDAETIEAT
ncbi:MAG: hypothetical protein GY807_14605 [Gammaproteobacteria bacterium]|nr:hypothetical protein [Gammaproteobacteria bacterium]